MPMGRFYRDFCGSHLVFLLCVGKFLASSHRFTVVPYGTVHSVLCKTLHRSEILHRTTDRASRRDCRLAHGERFGTTSRRDGVARRWRDGVSSGRGAAPRHTPSVTLTTHETRLRFCVKMEAGSRLHNVHMLYMPCTLWGTEPDGHTPADPGYGVHMVT
jgi:hypothetical protein